MNVDILKNPLNWITVFLAFTFASFVWRNNFGSE